MVINIVVVRSKQRFAFCVSFNFQELRVGQLYLFGSSLGHHPSLHHGHHHRRGAEQTEKERGEEAQKEQTKLEREEENTKKYVRLEEVIKHSLCVWDRN